MFLFKNSRNQQHNVASNAAVSNVKASNANSARKGWFRPAGTRHLSPRRQQQQQQQRRRGSFQKHRHDGQQPRQNRQHQRRRFSFDSSEVSSIHTSERMSDLRINNTYGAANHDEQEYFRRIHAHHDADSVYYADKDYFKDTTFHGDGDENSMDMSLYTSKSKSTVQYHRHNISSIGGPVMDDDAATFGTYDNEHMERIRRAKQSIERKDTRYETRPKLTVDVTPGTARTPAKEKSSTIVDLDEVEDLSVPDLRPAANRDNRLIHKAPSSATATTTASSSVGSRTSSKESVPAAPSKTAPKPRPTLPVKERANEPTFQGDAAVATDKPRPDKVSSAPDKHTNDQDGDNVYTGPVDLDATLPDDETNVSNQLLLDHDRLGLALPTDESVEQPKKPDSEITLKTGSCVASLKEHYETSLDTSPTRSAFVPVSARKPRKETQQREAAEAATMSPVRPVGKPADPSGHTRDSSTLWHFSPENSQRTRDDSVAKMLLPVSMATASTPSIRPDERLKAVDQPHPEQSPRSQADSLVHSSAASSSIHWDILSNHSADPTMQSPSNLQAMMVPRPILDRGDSEGASSLDNSSIFQFSPQSSLDLSATSPHGQPQKHVGAVRPKSLLESFARDEEFSVASIDEWSSHLTTVQPNLKPPPPPPPEAMPMPDFGPHDDDDDDAVRLHTNTRAVSPAVAYAMQTLQKYHSPRSAAAESARHHPWSMPQSKYFTTTPKNGHSYPPGMYGVSSVTADSPDKSRDSAERQSSLPTPTKLPGIVSSQSPVKSSSQDSAAPNVVTPNGPSLMDQDTTTSCTDASEGYVSFGIRADASNECSQTTSTDDENTQASPALYGSKIKLPAEQFMVQGGPVGERKMLFQQDDALSDVSSTIHKRMVTKNEKGETVILTEAMLAGATRLLDLAGCNAPASLLQPQQQQETLLEDELEYHDREDEPAIRKVKQPATPPRQVVPVPVTAPSSAQSPPRQQPQPPKRVNSFPQREIDVERADTNGRQTTSSTVSEKCGTGMDEETGDAADDQSTSSTESAGAVLLTQAELERHIKVQERKQPLSIHRVVSTDGDRANSLSGYEQWKLEREQHLLKLKKLQKQQAKAEKRFQRRRDERRNAVDGNTGKENVNSGKQQPVESSPTATNTSYSQSVPGSAKPSTLSARQMKKQNKKQSEKRRWAIFGRRKQKSVGGKAARSKEAASGQEKRPLRLDEFMSVTSHQTDTVMEPPEVAAMSLEPLNTLSKQLRAAGHEVADENRTSYLAQQYLEMERRKEKAARDERERKEQLEFERIRKRKELALIEARRREASKPTNSHPSPYVPSPRSKPSTLGEQLSVIDSISRQRHLSGHRRTSRAGGADGESFASFPSSRDTPSVSAASQKSMNSSMLLAPCAICEMAERTHIAMPCMHYSFCAECVEELHAHGTNICPICEVQDVAFTRVLLH